MNAKMTTLIEKLKANKGSAAIGGRRDEYTVTAKDARELRDAGVAHIDSAGMVTVYTHRRAGGWNSKEVFGGAMVVLNGYEC